MASSAQDKPAHIAVFSPYLQGYYLGEIVDQIRQLCTIQKIKFTAVRTNSFGTFDLPLGLDHYTGVIILRNAVAPALAEHILKKNIPVVSIAYDYFPLDIPMVTCDNRQATELAYQTLREKGHSKIAYVGDFSQYDLRKRYEYLSDLFEENDEVESNSENFYETGNTLFRGGIAAAKAFLNRGDDSTAVICGAGLLALGFAEKIQHSNRDIAVVGFDATSITPVLAPGITSIDQNLHLIAHKSVSLIQDIAGGADVDKNHFVPAKLIDADTAKAEDYMVTCTERDVFSNPNYAKCLITNVYEWTNNIVESNLDEVMSLAPVFRDYMQTGILAKLQRTRGAEHTCLLSKGYTETASIRLSQNGEQLTQSITSYPLGEADHYIQLDGMVTTHMPVFVGKKVWAILSFSGPAKIPNMTSSYVGFTSYLDIISQNVGNRLLAKQAIQKWS